MIFGACDRMITAGDIEFEPDNLRKMFWFTPSMVAMWAGDASFQAEVIQEVNRVVQKRVAERPDDWWNVADVVDEYVKAWRAAKRKRAETEILVPIGLTFEKLVSGNHGLTDYMLNRLLNTVSEFRMRGEIPGIPLTETIICGVDNSGGIRGVVAHLYRLSDEHYSCEDATGFAAIGAGAWHANSQLMQAKYDSSKSADEGLWRTYVAKRRAEVAPGVGEKGTNMFVLGPQLGMRETIPQDWVDTLSDKYKKLTEAEKKASETALKGVGKWLATASLYPAKKQDVTPAPETKAMPPTAIPVAIEPPPRAG
jgi:hypothetical protein